jgi:hypothetical protein
VPVLDGNWLEPGQMVITIANSDVINVRREVDETTFARARTIIINDWESVAANRQVELTEPLEKGLVRRENVHELGDLLAGKARLSPHRDDIVFYKNNTGLAMQFAACGAILHRKLLAEGTNRTIPARMVRKRRGWRMRDSGPRPATAPACSNSPQPGPSRRLDKRSRPSHFTLVFCRLTQNSVHHLHAGN